MTEEDRVRLTHPDVERAWDSIAMYNRGDFDALRDFYSDDVVWHVGGGHALSGDYRGKDALFRYFAEVRELTGGSLQVEPQSILASDDEIAMLTRVTAERGGRTLDVLLSQTFRVGPDGRWTEYWAIADDQEAVDAFWSDE